MRRILLVGVLAATLALPLAPPSLGGATKSASVAIGLAVGADGNCYPVSTATWQGYQVNRVRHIFYLRTAAGDVWQSFTTTGYPQGESHTSGTMTSTSPVPFYRGETWYVHALFRSNGGAILAEASSPDLVVLDSCPARPT
jgi:hypothetical protein